MEAYIFGAKATAAGLYKALSLIAPETTIKAFLVSNPEENVSEIWGCPVRSLGEISRELSERQKKHVLVYVAIPELAHGEVRTLLEKYGYHNLVMLDSHMEAELMEKYFDAKGDFPSLHSLHLREMETNLPKLTIYAASFYKDKSLKNPPPMVDYVKKLQLGCEGAAQAGMDITGQADFYDNTGDNISRKNPNRCEMTAHYWIWKNRLDSEDDYVGVCHYRRRLDFSEEDLKKLLLYDVDVVLPFPMIHYPNSVIQHTWYVPEKDWNVMRNVIREIYPAYEERMDEIFGQPYFYNYNMFLAKKDVFSDYCAWLYPILDRVEEISVPRGDERADRYTAYLSESLTTLYFLYHKNDLKIYHTGRLLFV